MVTTAAGFDDTVLQQVISPSTMLSNMKSYMNQWYNKDFSTLTYTALDGKPYPYDKDSVDILKTIYTSILDFANIYPTSLPSVRSGMTEGYLDLESDKWLRLTGFILLDAALETSHPSKAPLMADGLSIISIITEFKNAIAEFSQDMEEDLGFGDVGDALIGEWQKNYPDEITKIKSYANEAGGGGVYGNIKSLATTWPPGIKEIDTVISLLNNLGQEVSALTSFYNKIQGDNAYFDTGVTDAAFSAYNTSFKNKAEGALGNAMSKIPHADFQIQPYKWPYDPSKLGLSGDYTKDGSGVAGTPPHLIDFR